MRFFLFLSNVSLRRATLVQPPTFFFLLHRTSCKTQSTFPAASVLQNAETGFSSTTETPGRSTRVTTAWDCTGCGNNGRAPSHGKMGWDQYRSNFTCSTYKRHAGGQGQAHPGAAARFSYSVPKQTQLGLGTDFWIRHCFVGLSTAGEMTKAHSSAL